MFFGQDINKSYYINDMKNIKSALDTDLFKIMQIIKKCTSQKLTDRYDSLDEIIENINQLYNKKYNIINKKVIEKISSDTNLVAREELLSGIIEQVKSNYQDSKKIGLIAIKGVTGVGKKKLINTLSLRLQQEGFIAINSSITSECVEFKVITDIIKDIYRFISNDLLHKYENEIYTIMPDMKSDSNISSIDISDDKTRVRLIYRLANLFIETSSQFNLIICLKNFEKIDSSSLEVINYIVRNDIKGKIFFVVCSSTEYAENKTLKKLITDEYAKSLELTNFNLDETAKYIKLVLGIPNTPIDFAAFIYNETDGNPYYIYELIFMLYTKGQIYVKNNGEWNLSDINTIDLNFSLDIDEIAMSKINSLTKDERKILSTKSIFNSPVSLDIMEGMTGYNRDFLFNILTNFTDLNILSRRVDDWGIAFDFININIKNYLYEKLDSKVKHKLHEKASRLIEKKYEKENRQNRDELIYHMTKSDRYEDAVLYLVSSAEKMIQTNLTFQGLDFFERSYDICKKASLNIESIEICIRLGEIYTSICKYDKALEYFNSAEENIECADIKLRVDLYIRKFIALYNFGNIKEAIYYSALAKKCINNTDYIEGLYELVISLYNIMIFRRKHSTYQKIIKKLIDKCDKKKSKKYYARLLTAYGRSIVKNRYIESLNILLESVKVFEELGAYSEMPAALNCIGSIYHENYNNILLAREYYEKTLSISEKLKNYKFTHISYNNLAELYRLEDKYYDTISLYDKGIEIIKYTGNIYSEIMLFLNYALVCIELCEYKKAKDYIERARLEVLSSKDLGDLIEFYYSVQAYYEYSLGNYDSAILYAQKSVDMCINWGFNQNLESVFIIKLCMCYKDTNYKLEDCIEFCNYLFENGLLKLGREACIRFGFIYIYREDIKASRILYELGKSYRKSIDTEVLSLKYEYLYTMIENERDIVSKYMELIAASERHDIKSLTCIIYHSLGREFIKNNELIEALRCYISSFDILKRLVYNVPREERLQYLQSSDKYNIKKSIIKTVKLLTGQEFEDCYPDSEVSKYFDIEIFKEILRNVEIGLKFGHQYQNDSNTKKYLFKILDAVSKFTQNSSKNLFYLLELCIEITQAKCGFFAVFNEDNKLSTLCSSNISSVSTFQNYIVESARKKGESIMVTDSFDYMRKKDDLLIPDNITAFFCIPLICNTTNAIVQGDRRKSKDIDQNNISGYLYLETDCVINGFSTENARICTIISKLSNIIVDNYKLKESNMIDKLTRLYTKKYFETCLQSEIEYCKKEKEQFSVIMIDIDKFKSVNDTYGHQRGDEILQNTADIIMNNVREMDICARYGGEEFIILLPHTDSKDALNVSEKLRKKVENAKLLGLLHNLTISLGIANYPEHSTWAKDLIEKADQALYYSKQNGRNKSSLFRLNMSKSEKRVDKLSGIISGDIVKDQQNVEVLLDIISLCKDKKMQYEDKMFIFSGYVLDVCNANEVSLFSVTDKKEKHIVSKRALIDKPVNDSYINPELLQSSIKSKKGQYLIDWSNYDKFDKLTGMPDWQSVLVCPVLDNGEVIGIIYVKASSRNKEFDSDIYNFVRTMAEIATFLFN